MDRLGSAFKWLIALGVPLALVGVAVRLLLTPVYLQIEYRLPSFPPDEYGFTTEQRLHWGIFGIKYLLNAEPVAYLGDLRFENGEPLFTERELSHMHDVKLVVSQVLRAWYLTVAAMAALGVWAWRAGRLKAYRGGLRLGGWITLGIGAVAGVVGTLGAAGSGELFWWFFSWFHGLFFSGDTWIFAFSDTLIRLYPLRFWQDSILYIGALAALGAAALAFGLREHSSTAR